MAGFGITEYKAKRLSKSSGVFHNLGGYEKYLFKRIYLKEYSIIVEKTWNILKEAGFQKLEQQVEEKYGKITDVLYVGNYIQHQEINYIELVIHMQHQ